MPRKSTIRQPPSLPQCGTGPSAPIAGWSVSGTATANDTFTPLTPAGTIVYSEPAQRHIDALLVAGGADLFGETVLPGGTLRAAVDSNENLEQGVQLEFVSTTGPIVTGSVWHSYPAIFDTNTPDAFSGPTASAWPSILRQLSNDDLYSRQFFLPALELTTPGGAVIRRELPTSDAPLVSLIGVLTPCDSTTATAVGHVQTRDVMNINLETLTRSYEGQSPGMHGDVRLHAEPATIYPAGQTAPLSPSSYLPTAPSTAQFRLRQRSAAGQYSLNAGERITTRAAIRRHRLQLDRATGSVTLEFVTGPTGTTGPTAPWAVEFRLTGPTPSAPANLVDLLTATITGPTGHALPAGAYRLRVEQGFSIPYGVTPYNPSTTGLKPTPTGNLPTAPWLIYPAEIAFVIDPTAPAAITSSPPSASKTPVQSLTIAASERGTNLETAAPPLEPYVLTRDGQPITGGYRLWPSTTPGGAQSIELIANLTTQPGRYSLTARPSGVLRDRAANQSTTPWNPVSWLVVTGTATAPAAGELEQFPEALTTAPARAHLTFSEPVTGISANALTVRIDGTEADHSATVTGADAHYAIANLADLYDRGTAIWLEFDTSAVRTISGARTPEGPLRSAWVKSQEPAPLPAIEAYAFPSLTVGPNHFAVWAPTVPPANTGPRYAGIRQSPTGRAYPVALRPGTNTRQADTLAPAWCASGSTAPPHELRAPIPPGRLVPCPAPRGSATRSEFTNIDLATPAPDDRHANYAPPPTDISTITVQLATDDYRAEPYYETNAEYLSQYLLAEVWPLFVVNGSYTLTSTSASGARLAPGLYAMSSPSAGQITITRDPNHPTPAWELNYYQAVPFPETQYTGTATGPGPLTQPIVDDFIAANGLGGQIVTVESSRVSVFGHNVTWQIRSHHFQAWAHVSREFPEIQDGCGTAMARAGGLRLELLVRACYVLHATGAPLDRLYQLRYKRTAGEWYEIETRPHFEPRENDAINKTYHRARHFGFSVLLSPAEAAAWLAGTPVTRRFPTNALFTSDGLGVSWQHFNPDIPPAADYEPPIPTGAFIPTGVHTPASWCTITISSS